MSKFHSMVSRRDFMKGLGLAGVGLGGTALVSPAFHDLDELMSSTASTRKRAWWIKEVDHPTVEIDWDIMARHHGFHSLQSGAIMARYVGLEEMKRTAALAAPAKKEAMLANKPGLTLRDAALSDAANPLDFRISGFPDAVGTNVTGQMWNATGPSKASILTPEQRGVPKWNGTPEENFKMLQAAMIFFGASAVGASEIDEHHKKLIGLYGDNISENYFPYEGSTNWPPPDLVIQPIVFGDAPDFAYDSIKGKTTIPSNIPIYSISYLIPQANEAFRTGIESYISSAANISRYRIREKTRQSTLAFLKGLGYHSLADSPYRGIPSAAGSALSGLTENSRQTIMSISPEHGSTTGIYDLLTDLPVESTKPIDAGMWRFCQTCGICAVHCPTSAIEPKGGREPSWEPYPSATNPKHPALPGLGFSPMGAGESEYFKIGRKTFWNDMIACRYGQRVLFPANGCRQCYGACVFNSQNGPMIHDVVRATAATTSVFNSFFARMDNVFGFGPVTGEEIEGWWDMDLPAFGYSTLVGARHGGYK